MNEYGVVELHSPRELFDPFRPAVGFAVDKVAPSADCLPEHHRGGKRIQHGKRADLFHPVVNDNGEQPEDYRAVYRDTAAAYVYHVQEALVLVGIPVRDNINKPRADDCDGNGEQRDIVNIIRPYVLLLCAEPVKQQERKHDPCRKKYAVPLDIHPENGEGGAVHFEHFDTEPGKSDPCCHKLLSFPFAFSAMQIAELFISIAHSARKTSSSVSERRISMQSYSS